MFKIFDRWAVEDIKVAEPGLRDVISIAPKLALRSGGRYAGEKFHRSKISIVERLANKLMVPGHKGKKHFKTSGHCGGKAQTVYNLLKSAFSLIEAKTGKNPIEVFVKAIENAAPRAEIVTIEYGGARYPKAVECGPQRRVDLVLRHFAQGAYQKAFGQKKRSSEALAEEIINAYNNNSASVAISKKFELERQAEASR